MTHRGRPAGFTLIELLIAIAVVGILMAAAVASYEFAMTKTRRAAAEGCLAEAAQAVERHYTLQLSYATATLDGCSGEVSAHYAVGFAAGEPTQDTFRIEAVPQGRQAEADAACGTLSIDHTGVRRAGDGSEEAFEACW